MVEVIGTDEFAAWYMELDRQDDAAVDRAIELPGEKGVALGFPYSSAIKESTIAMRELRIQSGGRPLRILYKFDPIRRAILLIGGDKTGDARFYELMVPLAESIWWDYLKSVRKEGRK